MTYNAFLFPEAILDTPRLFTAIAEWLAIFSILIYAGEGLRKKRMEFTVCFLQGL